LHNISEIQALQQRLSVHNEVAAYNSLFRIFSPQLLPHIYQFVHSRELSEEILSDVFLKVWQIRSRIMDIENLRVYLFTISRHMAFEALKKAKPEAFMDDIPEQADFSFAPDLLLIEKEAAHQIAAAINTLPPRCRQIFQLAKEEKMRYKEIAEIMGISVKTIDHQLSIAISRITAYLRSYLSGQGPPLK